MNIREWEEKIAELPADLRIDYLRAAETLMNWTVFAEEFGKIGFSTFALLLRLVPLNGYAKRSTK